MGNKVKHFELWSWYRTKDNDTFLRVIPEYTNPEDHKRYYAIQEYRNCLTIAQGLTHGQAFNRMYEECEME